MLFNIFMWCYSFFAKHSLFRKDTAVSETINEVEQGAAIAATVAEAAAPGNATAATVATDVAAATTAANAVQATVATVQADGSTTTAASFEDRLKAVEAGVDALLTAAKTVAPSTVTTDIANQVTKIQATIDEWAPQVEPLVAVGIAASQQSGHTAGSILEAVGRQLLGLFR
jgi:hypothetical protein